MWMKIIIFFFFFLSSGAVYFSHKQHIWENLNVKVNGFTLLHFGALSAMKMMHDLV